MLVITELNLLALGTRRDYGRDVTSLATLSWMCVSLRWLVDYALKTGRGGLSALKRSYPFDSIAASMHYIT